MSTLQTGAVKAYVPFRDYFRKWGRHRGAPLVTPFRATAAEVGQALFLRGVLPAAEDLEQRLQHALRDEPEQLAKVDADSARWEILLFAMFSMHYSVSRGFGPHAGAVGAALLHSMKTSLKGTPGWSTASIEAATERFIERSEEYATCLAKDTTVQGFIRMGGAAARHIMGSAAADGLVAGLCGITFGGTMEGFAQIGKQYEVVE